MNLKEAQTIANELLKRLEPFCDRIHIAGSIRRQSSEVKDIEIVCEPVIETIEDLFGNTTHSFRSAGFIYEVFSLGIVLKGQPDNSRYCKVGINGKFGEINVDLFIPDPKDYWRQYAIRTGSAEYSHKVIATGWNKVGWVGTKDGLRKKDECTAIIDGNGKTLWKCHRANPTLPPVWDSEEEFFSWIQRPYIDPKLRNL